MARASEFSGKVRSLAFKRCEGKCEKCGAKLKVGEGEYDHIIPLALTGESTLDNCQVLCRPCHRDPGAKTAEDVKAIAKSKRREALRVRSPQATYQIPRFLQEAQARKASHAGAPFSLP